MSRWDALKPTASDRRTRQQQEESQNRRRPTPGFDPSPRCRDERQPSRSSSVQPSFIRGNKEKNRLSDLRSHHFRKQCGSDNEQPYVVRTASTTSDRINTRSRFEEILRCCRSSGAGTVVSHEPKQHEENLKNLAEFIMHWKASLPADRVVKDAVEGIFLPALLEQTEVASNKDLVSPSLSVLVPWASCWISLWTTIQVLLHDSSYMAGLMLPIVHHVTAHGKEEQIANPVRKGIFQTLQNHLGWFARYVDHAADQRCFCHISCQQSSSSSNQERTGVQVITQRELHDDECCDITPAVKLAQAACGCLVTALQTAYALEGTKRHAGGTDLDVTLVPWLPNMLHQLLRLQHVPEQQQHRTISAQLLTSTCRLVLELTRRQPESAAALASNLVFVPLLGPSTGASNACQDCGLSPSAGSFLGLLHAAPPQSAASAFINDPTTVLIAMEFVIELIPQLPLGLWLEPSKTTPAGGRRSLHTNTGTFSHRIATGLESILRITTCWVHRYQYSPNAMTPSDADELPPAAIFRLVQVVLIGLPFDKAPPSLEKHACNLVDAVMAVVTGALKANTGIMTVQLNDVNDHSKSSNDICRGCSSSNRRIHAWVQVINACLGGNMTPQGHVTPLSHPLQRWLAGPAGGHLAEQLLLVQVRNVTKHKSSACEPLLPTLLDLLLAILRAYPCIVLQSQAARAHLSLLTTSLDCEQWPCQYCRSDGAAILIIEAFLHGRSNQRARDDHDQAIEDKVASQLVQEFLLTLNDVVKLSMNKLDAKAAAIRAYAYLLPADWEQLTTKAKPGTERSSLHHISPILEMCLPVNAKQSRQFPETPALLQQRSDCCKTIGDIVTHCLSPERLRRLADMHPNNAEQSEIFNLFNAIGHAMVQVVKEESDDHAMVRCMAFFAMGNLIDALCHLPRFNDRMMDFELLAQMARCSFERSMSDPCDKVLSNAMRTVGKMACFVVIQERNSIANYTPAPVGSLTHLNIDRVLLVGRQSFVQATVMDILLPKIRMAVDLPSHLSPPSILSWKQRSFRKKHGWGACHAVAGLVRSGLASFDRHSRQLWDNDDEEEEAGTSQASLQNGFCLSQRLLSTLILDCIQHSATCHEKVTLSAMEAVMTFDPETLSHLSGTSGLIGRGMVASFTCLFPGESSLMLSTSHRLQRGAESFLVHLLRSASIVDVHHFLGWSTNHGSNKPEALQQLYQFMIRHHHHHNHQVGNDYSLARAFDCFALAMQLPDVMVDIEMERCFSQQAMLALNHPYGNSNGVDNKRCPNYSNIPQGAPACYPGQEETGGGDDDEDEL